MKVSRGPFAIAIEVFFERLVTLNAPVSDTAGGYFFRMASSLTIALTAFSLMASLAFSWISYYFFK
jgi:hypothetical protein